jgi:hypothetical protein
MLKVIRLDSFFLNDFCELIRPGEYSCIVSPPYLICPTEINGFYYASEEILNVDTISEDVMSKLKALPVFEIEAIR